MAWCCERALERGILPHTNLGALPREDLARLREVTASQGLMLESMRADLVAHQGSPTKDPALRLETIRAAGELRIPFTSGILVGIGETEDDRIEALEALAAVHAEHGHLQEVILQNFVPHRRYYGEEPAEIAEEAQRERHRRGDASRCPRGRPRSRSIDMRALVRACRRLMPDVGIQIPPNLSDWWLPLVDEGATDLGGLSANGDHISPEHPFPSRARDAQAARAARAGARRAPVRLPAVHGLGLARPGRARRDQDQVLVVHPAQRLRPARGAADPARPRAGRDRARARRAMRSAPRSSPPCSPRRRPEAIEDMRQAADALRAELAGDTVTFVVNRNINVSNVCTVGCAFCGFGQGRRSPDAYEHSEEEFRRRVREAVDFGATEICMQSGIHPDWKLEDYERWLRIAKDEAPHIHLHAYSPMEVHFMAGDLPLAEVFGRLREAGLGSTPGTAAEVLHDGVRQRISPNKLPVARWVEIIEAAHAAGVRSTVTVMFGHIEEPWELAEHMRVVRELQERTGGFTEFVPLSFIPFHTLLGRTHGIEEISREDNLRHTAAFRLALGRTIPSLQASWVKMGLDAATEALDWGVNDLGGTLMEESISRLAGSYHGVKLEPADLIGAAHAAGRPAAERDTLYGIRERYPVAATVSAREARLQGLGRAVRPGRAARVLAARPRRSGSRSSPSPTTSSRGATTAATRRPRSPGSARPRRAPSGPRSARASSPRRCATTRRWSRRRSPRSAA